MTETGSLAPIVDDTEASQREHAELLQFVYACPIGLVALDGVGFMTMLNPLGMQLVLPLARNHEVTNLFTILEPYAPDLRSMIGSFERSHGTVFENLRIFIGRSVGPNRGSGGMAPETVIACTLVKLGPDRLMATLSDVSTQVAQERRLRQAEAWFSSLVEGIQDFAALSLDAGGLIEHVSGSVCRQTGYAEDELLGRGIDVFDAPDPGSGSITSREQIALAVRDGWHLDEGWCASRDGSRRWCQRLVSVCREEGDVEGRTVSGFTVVLRAVSRQGADAGALRRRLTTDHLTGASNRAHFFEIAERQAAACRRGHTTAALVLVDIDHFKRVNDDYGHPAGDAVLKSVTAACRAELRPADTLARLGGEEFVVLMPGVGLREAREIAERLRRTVAAIEATTAQGPIGVTASFGCAVMDEHETDVAKVLAAADAALYEAKRTGRDRVVTAPEWEVAA